MLSFSGMPVDLEFLMLLLFCGLPLLALVGLLFLAYRMLQKRSGDRETRCRKCGHILRGISEPRCPECGERI